MKVLTLIAISLCLMAGAPSVSANSNAPQAQKEKKTKEKKELKTVEFHVHMHCQDCVKKITENLSFEKGVKGLDVSLEDHRITVKYDNSKNSAEGLTSALKKLGYTPESAKEL